MTEETAGGGWQWNGAEWVWWDGHEWLTAEQVAQSSALPPLPPPTGAPTPESPTTVAPTYGSAANVPPVSPSYAAAVTPGTPGGGPPPRRGLSGAWITAIVLGAVLALALVGTGIAFVMTRTGGDDDVITLQTEPLSSANAAFTPPMGTDTPVATPVATSGVQNANAETQGLFGGTLDNSSCDKAALVAFLQANPDKAGPWAQTLGISTAQIPEFVAPLTPVLLRSDTAVTNHGFENGTITVVPAVLQAGTAVLVNQFGQPVVKCYCGNPLTAPPPGVTKVRYTGPTWPAFVPGAMTVVVPSTVVIDNYVLVDVTTNVTFVRPGGTDGVDDTPGGEVPTPTPTPTATATPTPLPTQQPTQPVVPPPTRGVTESGRESAAIAAVQDRYRACVAAAGESSEGVEDILAQATYEAAPTGNAVGEYVVLVTDESGGFEFTVNVDSGTVAATNADAQEVASYCPGTYS